MLKKLIKLVMMFSLLMGCYIGYVRAFTMVVARLTAARKVVETPFAIKDSKSKREAILLAREQFGPKHWAAEEELALRYYNHERGFWLYSEHYDRIMEEDGVHYDGKRIRLKPAAIIWRAKDGSSTKTVTAEEAIIDLNQPLSFNTKPDSEPIIVRHARLERNVMIRDDRGTINDASDDLLIGPLTWAEFDDDKLLITSDSDVLIVDRDTRITGLGMIIKLRPKSDPTGQPGARPAGFEGAQNAQLNQNVHVVFTDVNKTGMVNSQQTAKKDAPKNQKKQDPVPLDLVCDGPMQVNFPKPHMPVKEGPPAPSDPTLVHFERNVVVRRGKLTEKPDQLDSDNLDLTFYPADKPQPSKTAPPSGSGEQKGVMGDLVLKRVHATGHAVWLRSPTKGVRIFCNELLHKIAAPEGPDQTYWRADKTRKVVVEKYDYTEERPQGDDGPVIRKPKSITHIWTVDATMVDNGTGMDAADLFANGPGLMETRPIPDKLDSPLKDVPPDRTAVWQDLMMLKNTVGPNQKIVQRKIVLKGHPRVVDRVQQQSIAAVETITTWLKPKPPESRPVQAQPLSGTSARNGKVDTGGEGQDFQIERLLAIRDVHLVAPSKNLTARERLDANFREEPTPVVVTRTTTRGTAQPGPETITSTTAVDAQANANAAAPETQPKEQAPEPAMVAVAQKVEADIVINPKGGTPSGSGKGSVKTATTSAPTPGDPDSDYQVRDMRLYGAVRLHQDPSPGKTKGQDAWAEKLVLHNEGPGRAIVNLYDRQDGKGNDLARADRLPPAKVVTEDMYIEGPELKLNQLTDEAWVIGPGKLVQYTDRGLLSDKTDGEQAETAGDAAGRVERTAKPKDARTVKTRPKTRAGKVLSDKVPLEISWRGKMLFYGRSVDPEGRPAAKAEFYQNVRADMEDGRLLCTKVMTTYTDRPVPLAQVGNGRQAGTGTRAKTKTDPDRSDEAAEPEPKPDLALIDMVGNAWAINRKVDPDRPVVVNLQRINSEHLIYDHRTGDFESPCAGIVYLYDKNEDSQKSKGSAGDATASTGRPIRPVSGKPGDRPGGKTRTLPFVLTQIKFSRQMIGQVGTGKKTDKAETRWADFFGDVEAARTPVANEGVTVSFDKLPPDTYFLTSQTMRVVNEPPPPGSPADAPARSFLKAWENAYAKTDDSMIQADVITYDSHNDLIYANGLEGRRVEVVQQAGPGQPGSSTPAEAVRVNPKTGKVEVIGPNVVQMIDKKTGTRPSFVAAPDPNAKGPKPRKNPFRVPYSNFERKGFTGK